VIREEEKNGRGNKKNLAQSETINMTNDNAGNKLIINNYEMHINIVGVNL